MGTKTKLSPAMTAAMWIAHFLETQPGSESYSTPFHLRGTRVQERTWNALAARGYIGRDGDMSAMTNASRAWVAEQIEAARAEALTENMERADMQDASLWYPAARFATRFGALPVQPQEIENDRIDALREHVRRAQRATDGTLFDSGAPRIAAERAELDALALAARWDVVNCPVEIIERDEAEAYAEMGTTYPVRMGVTHLGRVAARKIA